MQVLSGPSSPLPVRPSVDPKRQRTAHWPTGEGFSFEGHPWRRDSTVGTPRLDRLLVVFQEKTNPPKRTRGWVSEEGTTPVDKTYA